MFGQIAGSYDFLNHFLSLGIDYWWRRRTVGLVAPVDDGPILDVCTGTGDLALAYWRALRRLQKRQTTGRKGMEEAKAGGKAVDAGRCTVVGADFCRPMLSIGKVKGCRAGAHHDVTFVEADAQQLPFADDTFQIVCVAFGLRNVADTDAGIREMVRVCRPGGRVAVLEFSTPRLWPLGALYGWYFRHVLPRVGQALARNAEDAYCYLPQSVGQFPQAEALVRRMEAAGLRRAWFRRFTLGVASLYVGEK